MTSAIKILLKNHLDDLKKKDFENFQWHLLEKKREGQRPILRSDVEEADTKQTVDKMVQAYGQEEALNITVDVLMDINNNDLAMKLMKKGLQYFSTTNVIIPSEEKRLNIKRETLRDAEMTITQEEVKVQNENYGERSQDDPSGGHRNDSESYQTPSKTIKEKWGAFEKVKTFCDFYVEYIENQRRETEKKIKDDFEKLHGFLKKEEAARIAALEEEKTKKICMMQKITELSGGAFSLSETLKDMEDLGAGHWFLENFRTEMERTQNALPDPRLLPQALINVSNHVGNLQFRVLEKMLSIVKHTPVVLDPNTASPCLSLSEDLTTVTVTDTPQQRPGNPERNTSCPQVLGCEGFDSGKHSWEVEVGNQPGWILGVAEEAQDRKEEMWSTPQNGRYTITKSNRGYTDVKSNLLLERPNRIRIELDYENGRVSFHDADNNTSMLTYEERFTQKLYPYFAFVETNDNEGYDDDEGVKRKKRKANSSGGHIEICESEVSLTVT